MTLERYEIDEVLRDAIKLELAGVCVACPAIVAKVHDDGQRVDAQPMVRGRRLDADGVSESYKLPQVMNVPVAWPGASGLAQTFPLKSVLDVGGVAEATRVLLVFCDRSLDEWLAYGAIDTDPISRRRHNITDAVAIPSLRSFSPLELLAGVPTDRARFGQYALTNPTRVEVTEIGAGGASSGFVRIGNDNAELLALLEQLLAALQSSYVVTSLGNQPILYGAATPLSTLTATVRALLDQIREP